MKNKVIHRKYLPTRLPFTFTIVLLLCFEVYELSGIIKGVLFTFLGVVWIVSILALISEKPCRPGDI